jgi:hypothetical protein
MGIAGVEPHQLAPTVGTTGSGSTDSPAPSPTNAKIDIANTIDTTVGIAVPTDTDTNAKIDIANTIDTAIGIAVPTNTDTNAKINIDTIINTTIDTVAGIAMLAINDAKPLEPEVNIVESIIINIASPNATDLNPAATIVGPTSGTTGAVSAITRGFDMGFGLFNFHVDNDGVAELISVGDSTPPAMAPSTPPVTEGNPSATAPLAPLEEEPRLKDSTPLVGSNDFEDPPPSPTTAYCTDSDAYHFVGAGDFSSHEFADCDDPRGGTAAVYPTISECKWALNALTLCTAPYDPDYVKGLYSDYTCSDDDDIYPKAKGKIGNSDSSYSSGSAMLGNEYMVDYDSKLMVEVESYLRDDDVYPPALGKISDDSTPLFGGHCMMASHGYGNEHRSNDGRNRSNTGQQFITQEQIRYARRVYAGEADMGPNPSPQELAALRFVVQEQKDQISADRRILERRRDEADASSRRRATLSSHYSSSIQHRTRSHIPPGANTHNIARNLEAEFNEADLLPKIKEAAIMATTAYIAANTANGDEHMRHLRNLALKGVRVLQGTTNQERETTPRRAIPPIEQFRHPAVAPIVAPRTQVVEPINGELRHGLDQNRVDHGRARCEAHRFEEERDLEVFAGNHDGLCGAECFSLLIHSTPLPKGIKLSDGVVKFNGQ